MISKNPDAKRAGFFVYDILQINGANPVKKQREQESYERQEYKIDEALKESFPASDTPSFVAAGVPIVVRSEKISHRRSKAAAMASETIDGQADSSASSEQQQLRKRRLLDGPKEFRGLRRDLPK